MQLTLLRDALLRVSTPYSSIYHADDSTYMERSFVVQRKTSEGRHLRLHHICTEDRDAHLHDHPFDFYSLVLTGGYVEARPTSRNPAFHADFGDDLDTGVEWCNFTIRKAGSFAFRRCTDRHKIVEVFPDTWTLVLASPIRQWWGFYTPVGKIHWRDYEKQYHLSAKTER